MALRIDLTFESSFLFYLAAHLCFLLQLMTVLKHLII